MALSNTLADLDFIRAKMQRLASVSGSQLRRLRLELAIAKLDGLLNADDQLQQVKDEMHRRVDRMFVRET